LTFPSVTGNQLDSSGSKNIKPVF